MTTESTQETLDGLDDETTMLGFGGKKIDRVLEIGDELYLLIHCEVVSDGLKKQKGKLGFSAGAKTEILAELNAADALSIVNGHS